MKDLARECHYGTRKDGLETTVPELLEKLLPYELWLHLVGTTEVHFHYNLFWTVKSYVQAMLAIEMAKYVLLMDTRCKVVCCYSMPNCQWIMGKLLCRTLYL